jgi:tRNA pseudouridine38-40 synthase
VQDVAAAGARRPSQGQPVQRDLPPDAPTAACTRTVAGGPLRYAAPRRPEAARLLVGEHDFSAFRSAECQAKSPVRTLHSLALEVRGERFDFVVRANAFLHHMVRNLMGSLVHIGVGSLPPEWLAELLAGRDRTRAAPTFDAAGLYLTHIRYPSGFALPETSDRWPFA